MSGKVRTGGSGPRVVRDGGEVRVNVVVPGMGERERVNVSNASYPGSWALF